MADELVAARAERGEDFGAVAVEARVDETRREAQGLEEVEKPPHADAVAVVAPGEIEDVGRRPARRELGAEPFAEGEMLEVEAEIDGEALAARPVIRGRLRIGL